MRYLLPTVAAVATVAAAALGFVGCTNFGGVTETSSSQSASVDRLACGGPLCGRTKATWRMPHGPDSGFPNPMSYRVEGGVVTDEVTQLKWEQASPVAEVAWEDAARHCESLELGGSSDWRLPSRIELLSLIDFTKNPMIDLTVFPDMEWGNSSSHTFWTFEHARDQVQTDAQDNETFRSKVIGVVSFNNGTTSEYTLRYQGDSEPTKCRVRCVR